MKYGDKRKYRCNECGDETYFRGKVKERSCNNCKGGKYQDMELHKRCPHCKSTIRRESTDTQWKCRNCGHKAWV